MQAQANSNRPEVSLLWPSGVPQTPQSVITVTSQLARDIGLDYVISNLGSGDLQRETVERILMRPCLVPEVIGYRQDVLEDLLGNPALVENLQQLMPTLEALAFNYYRGEALEAVELYEVTWRLGELEGIVACVDSLGQTFRSLEGRLRSEGLHDLEATIRQIADDPAFRELVEALPDWLERVRASQSVTIGVNLDPDLKPLEAILLSVNDKRFTSGGFLDKLLDRSGEPWRGIAPLHTSEPKVGGGLIGAPIPLALPRKGNPMMAPLFRDLAVVLDKVCKPISRALKTYTHVTSRVFVGLWQDLVFYLPAVRLIKEVEACGLPMCRPQIAPAEERLCQVKDSYNLNLALQKSFGQEAIDLSQTIVTNDIFLEPQGRIQILTGPNLGGKTTYLQAVGLTQILAQAGLYVPGTEARISPADGIYSHFPVEEKLERGTGRFGDEAQRLKEIFSQATRHSLILLNESLTSTSPGESLYLAQDVIRIMRMIGVRAIYATHMHELASLAAEANQEAEGDSEIISVVASRIDEGGAWDDGGHSTAVKRSYKVRRGPPMGRSFARELARRYGISYEQLVSSLQERGILRETAAADGSLEGPTL